MTALGFTGTRRGMTPVQRNHVWWLVKRVSPSVAHHGDCVGADAQFHAICTERFHRIVIHPPLLTIERARCQGDEVREPMSYMQRNRNIVAASDVMIAAPYESSEQTGGGTWRTIELARKTKRRLFIVWPDGRVSEEPA